MGPARRLRRERRRAGGVLSLPPRRVLAAAALVLALSPIQAVAIRSHAPDVLLVVALLAALALWAAVDLGGHPALALALGLPIAALLVAGSASFAAVAVVLPVALAARRRAAAATAAVAALSVAAAAVLAGAARSPFDYGPDAAATPAATALGLLRCAGASFTRVIGIEYQLVVPQARYALPLSGVFVGLMALGARNLPRAVRCLAVAGALAPFAVGGMLALVTGHVAPLQAHRQLAGLPFVALLLAAGLASLRGLRAWAAGALVLGSTAAALALALSG